LIEPFKYLIQPVAIERDESGRITGEKPAQVLVVYSAAEAVTAIEQFEQELHRLNEEGRPHEPDQHKDNGRAQADASGRSPTGGVRQS
jgi:hypothetical protein